MLILDTSEIQARKPNPQAREISRLTWKNASIPQNAIPITIKGKPYVLEFDEYTKGTTGGGNANAVGAARIIDISDETKPRVISNLRLQVNQSADHQQASGDPGASSPVQGYAAHYCNVPTRVDPKVVACSFIASGLRVFDISDPAAPKEIAYYVSPTQPRVENGVMASNFAMSQPAFAPERREVWFTDGGTGFYSLRVDKSVWPADDPAACASVAKTPHGYVTRGTLRASRGGFSLRGRAYALCRPSAAAAAQTVKRVTIAVARVARSRCSFLTARGTFTAARSCRRPAGLTAQGTTAWKLKRTTRLTRGSYRIYVYATDAAGKREAQPRLPNARFTVH
jgi:hypothetical protein